MDSVPLDGIDLPSVNKKQLDRFKTQQYSCVTVIPEFDDSGNLPLGEHIANWAELEVRYGTSGHRRKLLKGLKEALLILKSHGCTTVYIDGSFVTSKSTPQDFDVCWDLTGVDLIALKLNAPILFQFANGRAAQKAKFGGELFPAQAAAGPSGVLFLDFFKSDKTTGLLKGIVKLNLVGVL